MPALDGSQGRNRAPGFCLIAARHDLEAIQAYLYRFRDRDKTARAYQKDVPGAEVHLYDTGHFALQTHVQEIAATTLDFLARHLK